jgi:hypothetical protein
VFGGFRYDFENFGDSYYEMCITMSAGAWGKPELDFGFKLNFQK